jgi:hypothetical protein
VIYKLLGFTLAMIVGPIGTYFLTVDHVFGGMFLSNNMGTVLMQQRQLNVRGSYGSDHGECGVGGLCHCSNGGGSERGY